jgi:hypothetical protein
MVRLASYVSFHLAAESLVSCDFDAKDIFLNEVHDLAVVNWRVEVKIHDILEGFPAIRREHFHDVIVVSLLVFQAAQKHVLGYVSLHIDLSKVLGPWELLVVQQVGNHVKKGFDIVLRANAFLLDGVDASIETITFEIADVLLLEWKHFFLNVVVLTPFLRNPKIYQSEQLWVQDFLCRAWISKALVLKVFTAHIVEFKISMTVPNLVQVFDCD